MNARPRIILLTVLTCLGLSSPAFADCTPGDDLIGPHTRTSWVEGGLVYDMTEKNLRVCDGTNWIEIGGGGGGALSDGDKGDVTVSNAGATWTIDNGAVTYGKIQNVSTNNRVLGRATAGAGAVEEIAVGNGMSLSGGALNPKCASGVYWQGACWLTSLGSESCDTACSAFGGCHSATAGVVGAGGSLENCKTAARLLGIFVSAQDNSQAHATGCSVASSGLFRFTGSTTTCGATYSSVGRICACNN